MDNYVIAWYLRQIAILTELQGGKDFQAIAYKKAASTIEGLTGSIRELPKNKRASLPGIGSKILAMVEEYIETGRISKYEKLRADTHDDFLTMLKINGVGPKSIRLLNKHLGITSLKELAAAVKARKVRKIPGIGAKFEMRVAAGIEHLTKPPTEFTLDSVLPLAKSIVEAFKEQSLINNISTAGDVRRMKDTINQLDIVISCDDVQATVEAIKKLPNIHKLLTEDKSSLTLHMEYNIYLPVRFKLAKPESYIYTLHEQTGSRSYLEFINKTAKQKNVDLNQAWTSEQELLQALELPYVEPEIRELPFLDAIADNKLPNLVQLSDIKGDLHMHSHYSDGIHSIEEMAKKAMELGYEYIAITDHSQSLKIAKGLTVEKWNQQKREIQNLNKQFDKQFQILTGTEMDILTDTSLDFDEEFLEKVELVVASIHTGFQQDKERQTDKFLAALDSTYVDILAHPTGRLIARRAGYDIDLDRIFKKAQNTKTCLEINSSPDRLDLNAENARKAAKEYGLLISINTDAHDKEALHDMELGVAVARRAGLEAKDILNTKSKQELLEYLHAKRYSKQD
ncbi:DNA polymerase/3'-5' exonuclease PolX [Desulfuribacillus alkaliarsenatis]|uniref:DNA-directed DNA polymerase n=1 Tax=Desulfuribacillus alkaliarsenatis TaxID=766136 RepID=A0A1E5FYH4_9FIRM|nr:DNA polymerase/3'-5' exonuclease PolX [Desulfuribacillus alkaliarsenatis]OEF95624.1 hypothetical protein BHF68_12330 [Desulfuribacillus alkaliarsenatis]